MTAGQQDRSIGSKVGRGALWSLLNNVVLRLGVLVSGIVLARLLSPSDYGVFAVALVAMTLLQAFNELGVSLALVRWERDVREFAPTAMTIAVTTSTALYAVVWFAAPAFCDAMGSPSAVGVLRVLCFAVVLDGIAVVPATILNREFMQARRFFTDFSSFAVSTSITITLAVGGWGAMSFAIGQIAGNVVSVTVYLILCPVRVRPGWDPTIAKDLVRFGLPLAASSLLVLSVTNLDKIAIGALTDEVTLGLYLMAFNQSSLPLQVFSEAARRVSLAGFSRLRDDSAQLEQSLARGVGLLMAATIPVCALLACYAQPALSFVYGEKWVPAAQALQILAVLGLVRVVLFIGYDLLVALDGNRVLLGLQALWLATMLPALLIATKLDGIRGASLALLGVAALVVLPAFIVVLERRGVRLWSTFLACRRPLLGGALVVASAFVVRSFVDGSFAQLAVGGLVAVAVYLPVVSPMRSLLPGRSPVAVAA
ncbi:lipopolysaccharide biosynthesis protein [Umezawaea endophytica]|uniref:Lipopolysaccharide biosynthesis protein n=1 Tax=Umezawaea endophytica TaxID=1654476 RepID=A0A9X3AJ45_9PSEU|nr:lipopolysaccharide biosynthesis protein [Umezawaea endophytica]MCS7481290.1 lipopolysaccharide biosynthesis protein [Umezawaea endophytica]